MPSGDNTIQNHFWPKSFALHLKTILIFGMANILEKYIIYINLITHTVREYFAFPYFSIVFSFPIWSCIDQHIIMTTIILIWPVWEENQMMFHLQIGCSDVSMCLNVIIHQKQITISPFKIISRITKCAMLINIFQRGYANNMELAYLDVNQ